jgi:hypothetical protein
MADGKAKIGTGMRNQAGREAAGGPILRLGTLAAGTLGLLGFALAILQGLAANNDTADILERAVVAMFVLAAMGGLAGAIAGKVVGELLARQQEALAAAAAAQERAQVEATAAQVDAQTPPEEGSGAAEAGGQSVRKSPGK